MRVKLSDPTRLEELRSALRNSGVASVPVAEDTLIVLHPFALDEEEARVEITFFIKAWLAKRPDLDVDLAA
jgi:hypothetical protein